MGARFRGRRAAGPAAAPSGPLADAGAGAEEEALRARPEGEAVALERRSLEDIARQLTITAPSGASREITLQPGADGIAKAVVAAEEPGLYQVTDGKLTTHVAVRPIDPQELADMRATPERLAPIVEESRGAVLAGGARHAGGAQGGARARHFGPRLDRLVRNERYLVTGARSCSRCPPCSP